MNYCYNIKVFNDPEFYRNAVVFATREEAENAAKDKAIMWTRVEDWLVKETDAPANYKFEDGQLIALKENA